MPRSLAHRILIVAFLAACAVVHTGAGTRAAETDAPTSAAVPELSPAPSSNRFT